MKPADGWPLCCEAPGALTHRTARVGALNAAARIAENQGDYIASRTFAMEALALSRESGDKRETAMALNCLAVLAGKHDDFIEARSLLEQSLDDPPRIGRQSLNGDDAQQPGPPGLPPGRHRVRAIDPRGEPEHLEGSGSQAWDRDLPS